MRNRKIPLRAGLPPPAEGPAGPGLVYRTIVSPTQFGPVAIVWTGPAASPTILRVLISRPDRSAKDIVSGLYPGSTSASSPEIDMVAAGISSFLAGEDVTFDLDLVDMDSCPVFQRRVLEAEHGIPRGQVSTYRRIAQYLGTANGARAVGNALASNPFPILVPCHRAIRSDGTIGGFQGGPAMKRKLLEMEGIAFDDTGRVTGARYWY